MEGASQYAREYSPKEETSLSSTYRKLLGVNKCLYSMVHVCAGESMDF